MVTKAQKEATTKYENKVYSKFCIRIREDRDGITRDQIQKAADAAGVSINAYVLEAIKEKMNGGSGPPEEIEREPFFD